MKLYCYLIYYAYLDFQAAEIQRLEKLVAQNGSNIELIGKLRGDLTGAMNKVVYLDAALDDAKKKIPLLGFQIAFIAHINFTSLINLL